MSDESDEALRKSQRWATETPREASPRGLEPGVVLAGRFEIAERLGAGGMGQVFAAYDRTRQARVAVKILGRLTARSIGELKREFRAASELVHPNLVPLHQLFCDDVEWLFSMDLIEGVILSELWDRSRPPPDALLRHVFRQLAVALSVLHRAGTTHGDLKPSNFLITPGDHRVVLLDFGLARPIGLIQEQDFGGTPGYMAPEQSVGDPLTEATDWYSFGVVLYEALTGVLPFRIPLEKRLVHAPADLKDLCLRLLRFRPGDRPTGDEALRCFDAPVDAAPLAVMSPPSRKILVNRQAELAALNHELGTARSGHAAIALLHGPSGIGKTALVERFVQAAGGQDVLLVASRCRERESMGYKAADGLVDDIVRVLDGMDPVEAASLLPDGIEDLTVLFPALNAARAVERIPRKGLETADQAVVRLRAITAFRELFERLSARAPLIVWMDDLQWSDPESALLMGPLLRASGSLPLLFIGSYRTTQGGRGPMLDALFNDPTTLPDFVDLSLDPLSPEASEQLALESLPPGEPDAASLARNIGRDAGGHPLFIAELAHAVGSSAPSAGSRQPSTLLQLVRTRVAALPAAARGLLELTAVAGVPVSRSVLRQTQGLDFAQTEQALDLLRACRLLRTQGPNEDDVVDMHHDRIREIIAEYLDDTSCKAHHQGLARVLEADARTKPDVLAGHYEASGDLLRAGRYWLTAAEEALRALAFEHAAHLYEKGLKLAPLEPAERRAVQLRRAEALAYCGRGPAAADLYLETATTSGRDEAIELRRRAAEQLLLSGHLDRGLLVIQHVLQSLGMHEAGGARDLVAVAKGRLLVRLRGLRHVARAESEVPRDELARLDASWTLACSLSLIDPMRGAAFQSKHLLLALKAGEPRRLLRALSLEVSYAATPGVGAEHRTAHVLGVADTLVSNQSDYLALALLSLARGISAYLQGRLENTLTHCEEALKLLTEQCVGAVWETMSAQRFTIAALFFLGRLRRLGEFAAPLLAAAEGTGNLYATLCFRAGYTPVGLLARDRVDQARKQLDKARDEWAETRGGPLFECNLLLGETFLDFYCGDAEQALARIRAHWPKLAEAQLLRIGVLRVQLWHLRASALSLVAGGLPRGQRGRASELRAEARQLAGRMRRDRIKRAAPLADLVEAAIDRNEGEARSAEKRLGRCIVALDDLGMRLFSAAARARLGQLSGGANGQVLVERAYAAFQSEDVVNPSRMTDLLAPFRTESVRENR